MNLWKIDLNKTLKPNHNWKFGPKINLLSINITQWKINFRMGKFYEAKFNNYLLYDEYRNEVG